jgi:endonuclease YncB( thermonuclease family)
MVLKEVPPFFTSLPEPQSIRYIGKSGQRYLLDFAYPGLLQLFVDPHTASSIVVERVVTRRGRLVKDLPHWGLYLVEVNPGQEQQFLDALYNERWLAWGSPLTPTTLLSLPVAEQGSFSGKVVAITDSTILQVLHHDQMVQIRLAGIACPVRGQPFWYRTKQFLTSLVMGKTVTGRVHNLDYDGSLMGEVILSDGRNLSQELVKAGLAWFYPKNSLAETSWTLQRLETEARTAKRGLWIDPHPLPPWEFQKYRENSKRSITHVANTDTMVRSAR